VRLAVEGLCADWQPNVRPHNRSQKWKNCCQQMTLSDDLHPRELVLIDRMFHRLLAQASDNKLLMDEAELFL